ncbi:MAG: hypothetical protein D6706_11095 [Chloroflexi bacterium]|nr:MAG: hypothetical protein D6706_11095 [Chloroflexota bacterium]
MKDSYQTNSRTVTTSSLVYMGAVWLFVAAVILIFQLFRPATVRIEWETATELQTAGFHLYRSQSPEGEFVRITESLIPAKGNTVSGASYSFVDNSVRPGETYYYLLEEVELDATTRRYEDDLFVFTVPRITWGVVVLIAVCVLIGLGLIVSGLKEVPQ